MMEKSKGNVAAEKFFFLFLIVFFLLVSAGMAHSQSVRLLLPNGGENWVIGQEKNISWTSSGLSADVKVKLELFQHGRRLGTISSNRSIRPEGILAWKWKVGEYQGGTAAPGSDYYIHITTMDGQYTDRSDRAFRLASPKRGPSTKTIRPTGELKQAQKPFTIHPDFTITKAYYDQTARSLKIKVKNSGVDFSGTLLIYRKLQRFQARYTEFPNLTIRRNQETELLLYSFDWPQIMCRLDYEIIVDPRNDIKERNENNNRFKGPVYRTNPAPPLMLANDQLEIIGKNNRVKPFLSGGPTFTFGRGDVQDHIKQRHLFAVDVRYTLKNCWMNSRRGKVKFKFRWMETKADVSLRAGEAKSFTTRVWMFVHGKRSPSSSVLTLRDPSGEHLFYGMTTCSSSLQSWLGYPPDLSLSYVRIEYSVPPGHHDSGPQRGQRVRVNFRVLNKGGSIRLPWKVRFEVVAPDGTINHYVQERHGFPSNGRSIAQYVFTPHQTGFYRVYCTLDSENDIWEFDEDNNSRGERFKVD